MLFSLGASLSNLKVIVKKIFFSRTLQSESLRQSDVMSENSEDDDDDVVIGSSASLSRFRDNQPASRQSKRVSRSRDPTIYKDPEKQSEWYQNKNTVRNRASMSEYLDENEVEDERRRKIDSIRNKQKEGYLLRIKTHFEL